MLEEQVSELRVSLRRSRGSQPKGKRSAAKKPSNGRPGRQTAPPRKKKAPAPSSSSSSSSSDGQYRDGFESATSSDRGGAEEQPARKSAPRAERPYVSPYAQRRGSSKAAGRGRRQRPTSARERPASAASQRQRPAATRSTRPASAMSARSSRSSASARRKPLSKKDKVLLRREHNRVRLRMRKLEGHLHSRARLSPEERARVEKGTDLAP